jgi:DNA-binding MarR family transcriptional regulator
MNHREMGQNQPAFLLAQLGAHAASQFAERLGVLEIAPADAGILRLLRAEAGLSQQELAARLQIHPDRLVAILDNLEKRGLVERRANPDDRRLYSLHLTQAGGEALEKIGNVARKHQDALLSSITLDERNTLAALLLRIADQRGLVWGVHPGYQRLGRPKRSEADEGKSDKTQVDHGPKTPAEDAEKQAIQKNAAGLAGSGEAAG